MSDEIVVQTRALSKVYRDFWGRQKVTGSQGAWTWKFTAARSSDSCWVRMGLARPRPSSCCPGAVALPDLRRSVGVWTRTPRMWARMSGIGYLPEESYLYRFLNAEETLDFYARLFDMTARSRGKNACRYALIKQVGLDKARKRQLQEYSKGMSRRIGLAQALINNPDLDPSRRTDQRTRSDRYAGNEGHDPAAEKTKARRW